MGDREAATQPSTRRVACARLGYSQDEVAECCQRDPSGPLGLHQFRVKPASGSCIWIGVSN